MIFRLLNASNLRRSKAAFRRAYSAWKRSGDSGDLLNATILHERITSLGGWTFSPSPATSP